MPVVSSDLNLPGQRGVESAEARRQHLRRETDRLQTRKLVLNPSGVNYYYYINCKLQPYFIWPKIQTEHIYETVFLKFLLAGKTGPIRPTKKMQKIH